MKVTHETGRAQPTNFQDMKVGDFAVIGGNQGYSKKYNKLIVVRTYLGWVALDDPATAWSGRASLRVEILPPGTEITLTVE